MNFLQYMIIFIVTAIIIHQIVDFIIRKLKSIFNSSYSNKNKKNSKSTAQNLSKDSLNQSFKSQNSLKISHSSSSTKNMPKRLHQITSQIKKQNLKQATTKNDFSQNLILKSREKEKEKQKQRQKILLLQPRDDDTINSENSLNNNLQRQNSLQNNNNTKRFPLNRQLKTNMQYINQIHYLKQKNRELNNQKNQERQSLNELIKDNKKLLSKIDELSEKLQKKEKGQLSRQSLKLNFQQQNQVNTIQGKIKKQKADLQQKLIETNSKKLQQKVSLMQKQLILSKQKQKTNQNLIQNLIITITNQHLKQQKQRNIEQIATLKRQISVLKQANEMLNKNSKINQNSEQNLSNNKLQKQLEQKVNSLTQELMFCQKQLQQTYETEIQFKKQIQILKRNQLISVHTSPEYAKMREKLVKYETMITDLQRQLSITQSRQINFNNQPSYGSNGSSPFHSQYKYQNKLRYRADIAQNNKNYQNRPHYNSYQQSKILTTLKDSRKIQSFQNSNSNDSFKRQSRQRQIQGEFQSQGQRKSVNKFREVQYLDQSYEEKMKNDRQKKQKRLSYEIKKQSSQTNQVNQPQKRINKIPSREMLKRLQKNNTNQQFYKIQNQPQSSTFKPIPPVSPVSSVHYQMIKPKREKYKTLQSQQVYHQDQKKINIENGSDFKMIKTQNQKNMSQLQRIKQNLKNVKDLHRAILQESSDKPEQIMKNEEQSNELYSSGEPDKNLKKLYSQQASQTYRSKQSLKSPYFSKRYTFGQQTFQFIQKQKEELNHQNNVLTGSKVSNVSKSYQSQNFRESSFLLKQDINFLVRCIGDLKLLAMKSTQLLYTRVTHQQGRFGDNPHLHIDNISNILLVCKLVNKKVVSAFTQLPFTKESTLPSYRLKNKSLVIDVTCKVVLTPTGTNLTAYGLKSNSSNPSNHQQSGGSTIIYDQKAIIWGRNQLTIKSEQPDVMYSNLGNQYGIYKLQQCQKKDDSQYGFKQFLGTDEPWVGIEAIQIYRIMFH